jgi:hypothetical protein
LGRVAEEVSKMLCSFRLGEGRSIIENLLKFLVGER